MTIGGSLAVLAVGAILRYAVEDSWDAVDLEVVGLILMIVGAIGFVVGLLALVMSRGRSATPLGRHPFEGSRRPQRLSCDALRWVRERLRAASERAVADTNGTPSSKEQLPTPDLTLVTGAVRRSMTTAKLRRWSRPDCRSNTTSTRGITGVRGP